MRRATVFGLILWILGGLPGRSLEHADDLDAEGDPARGQLIFNAGDCASCHASPGQEDRTRLGGGLAIPSPFGTFRAPNISPDKVDGIGTWRTRDLANALHEGKRPDGSPYYPVLPYIAYTHLEMGDIRDLMAYLRSLPPVSGRPPPHELMFPFNVRSAVSLWQILYFKPGPLPPAPRESERWQRGRYLAEAMAHCAECHSSRNWLGAIREDTRYAGGPNPEGLGFAPNITPARIGSWSEAEIVRLLTDGHAPNGRVVGGSMAAVVKNTATLPQADREAIAIYVKSLPARPTPKP